MCLANRSLPRPFGFVEEENREKLGSGKKENSVGGFVGICIKKTLQTSLFPTPGVGFKRTMLLNESSRDA